MALTAEIWLRRTSFGRVKSNASQPSRALACPGGVLHRDEFDSLGAHRRGRSRGLVPRPTAHDPSSLDRVPAGHVARDRPPLDLPGPPSTRRCNVVTQVDGSMTTGQRRTLAGSGNIHLGTYSARTYSSVNRRAVPFRELPPNVLDREPIASRCSRRCRSLRYSSR